MAQRMQAPTHPPSWQAFATVSTHAPAYSRRNEKGNAVPYCAPFYHDASYDMRMKNAPLLSFRICAHAFELINQCSHRVLYAYCLSHLNIFIFFTPPCHSAHASSSLAFHLERFACRMRH